MLIKFVKKNAGILNIPHPLTDEEKKKMADAMRGAHVSPKFTSLVPGINEIPDAVWNKIKNNERIQTYLERKELVLLFAEKVEDKKVSTEKKKAYKDLTAKDFKELSAAEQEAIIQETELVDLLKKFKKSVKESVATMLNDRIDRLEHPDKYAEED